MVSIGNCETVDGIDSDVKVNMGATVDDKFSEWRCPTLLFTEERDMNTLVCVALDTETNSCKGVVMWMLLAMSK